VEGFRQHATCKASELRILVLARILAARSMTLGYSDTMVRSSAAKKASCSATAVCVKSGSLWSVISADDARTRVQAPQI
jgi:hypothetical protein